MSLVLIVNAGSSSLKIAVFKSAELIVKFQASAGGWRRKLSEAGYEISHFSAIGHRIVHGGTRYVSPIIVDQNVRDHLQKLCALAPLHMPFGLALLDEIRDLEPNTPNIACFDTAFHATQPDVETRLPLPQDYQDRGYRRYGFHGLNYEHVVKALPLLTGEPLPPRLLVAHLGNGASMCAILDGKSVATTMGYSTADGLVMSTRTGALDPGVLLALLRDDAMTSDQLEDLVYRKSGLLALSGSSSDMRELLASADAAAQRAVDHFCYHAARHAASLVPAIGGIDAMVFTGGIGENSDAVRAKIMAYLTWLKLGPDQLHTVQANEELIIASHAASLIE